MYATRAEAPDGIRVIAPQGLFLRGAAVFDTPRAGIDREWRHPTIAIQQPT